MTVCALLEAEFARGRGDCEVLVPMLAKLSARESEALYRFVQSTQWTAEKYGRRR